VAQHVSEAARDHHQKTLTRSRSKRSRSAGRSIGSAIRRPQQVLNALAQRREPEQADAMPGIELSREVHVRILTSLAARGGTEQRQMGNAQSAQLLLVRPQALEDRLVVHLR
jgi:hypothetical protein